MIRLVAGYLTFIALRLVLTVAVGWVALDYMTQEYEIVADAMHLVLSGVAR